MRPSTLLPLLGLALLIGAAATRALRRGGLELEAFETPERVVLPRVSLPVGLARIAGWVEDASGNPVAEALVKLVLGDEIAWTHSGADGSFALDGLPEGDHHLQVWSRHFHLQSFPLRAPAEGLRLRLLDETGALPRLPASERIDLAGELLPALPNQLLRGYEVLLLPAVARHLPEAPIERRATVDADRRFEFPELATGHYRVLILPPWARGAESPNLAAASSRELVHAADAHAAGLFLPLEMGALQGFAYDQQGEPVQGALALIHPVGRPEEAWPVGASDSSGTFAIGDLPPGRYRLEVRAGEALHEQEIAVASGHRHRLDLPPLSLRRAQGDG
jgi:hypothetical protein